MNIDGYSISTDGVDLCVRRIEGWINNSFSQKYFVCANPHSLVCARTDSAFSDAIREADLVTPDGAGIVLASRVLGGAISGRVTGFDIFEHLTARLNQTSGGRYFFLGSTEKVLGDIRRKMAIDFPNIEVVGTYSPPFKDEFSDEENQRMIDAINLAQPDVLWVGMTAPKQEKWIHRHRSKLNVKFIGAIGAVFDFYTGNVKRSHPVFRNLGLEWLPRFLRQPRKLWRRNMISTPKFLWSIFKAKMSSR